MQRVVTYYLFSEKIFPTIIIALLLKRYNREYYLIVHLIMSAVNSLFIAVLPSKHTWTNTNVCKQYGLRNIDLMKA